MFNIMTKAYASKIGFKVQPINVKAQKIDDSIFENLKNLKQAFGPMISLKNLGFFERHF